MAILDKELKDRLSKIDDIREELKNAEKSATKDIMNLLKDLMKANPLLLAIRWNQYTPHFNDGEPCVFSVGELEFKFSAEQDEYLSDWKLNDDFFDKKLDILNAKEITSLRRAVKDAQTVFNKLSDMESQLEQMFGDHMEVTVTADGVETEEFDHD